ncbi:hypothetical protein MG293_018095 [Ovis ammon polii]|uniref:Uncharacterized protein n=1 Tax=Ovis ammon polii TaxID=230172 RepID=A0AAD4Y307_OVIAM|nr:hypothetical protein MG293_018095 [Ovis ammon polii]
MLCRAHVPLIPIFNFVVSAFTDELKDRGPFQQMECFHRAVEFTRSFNPAKNTDKSQMFIKNLKKELQSIHSLEISLPNDAGAEDFGLALKPKTRVLKLKPITLGLVLRPRAKVCCIRAVKQVPHFDVNAVHAPIKDILDMCLREMTYD